MTIYTKASEVAGAIATRITQIKVVDGYETDIGLRVFRGRRNVDESAVPCAVLIEGADTPTDRPGRLPSVGIRQRFVIAAYVPCDANNPNDAAHAAIRDVKRAIFAGDATLGSKVLRVMYAGRDIGPRADGVPVVFVTVEIDVEYVEDLTNP
jgi:hypothetical protein